jgi:aspartate 1-decarboxylase
VQITLLKSKIHRAKVTQTELDYVGSVTLSRELMTAAGLIEYEKVLVVNLNNAQRFETYCLAAGQVENAVVCLNGAAARLGSVGDRVIIMSFCLLSTDEASLHRPTVVFLDEDNSITTVERLEKPGASLTPV